MAQLHFNILANFKQKFFHIHFTTAPKKYMEECVLRTQIAPLSAKLNRGINPERKKWQSPKLNLTFFCDPYLVYNLQMICLRGT